MGDQSFENTERALRAELAQSYRYLVQLGLNELASGNLSARVDDGMLISASGATAQTITEDTLVHVTTDGTWDPTGPAPSSEWQMHLEVYLRNEAAKAIAHTHSDSCVALASHGLALPGFTYVVGFLGGTDVPCVPYSTFGTAQLAADVAAALTDRNACLLANHGMVAHGESVEAAVSAAHRVEILCRQYLLARRIGEPRLLTDEEWTEFFAQMARLDYGEH